MRSKNNFEEKQNRFIQSLEGIGDILVFETKRQKNKLVLNGLQKFCDSIEKLFLLKQEYPEKFNQLALNPNFLKQYKEGNKNASFLLSLRPEENLTGFYTPINQIVRIYNAAINSQNAEISRFSVIQITWILETLASQENNEVFIEGLLRKLFEITKVGLKNDDSSASLAAINWYTKIVFSSWTGKDNFNLSYLALFDKYFYLNIRYIIAENQTAIFHDLVSSLIDGINLLPGHTSGIWDYGHIILRSDLDLYNQLDEEFNIERRTSELANLERGIGSVKELDNWLEKYDQLKKILEIYFSNDQYQQASKLEFEIKKFVTSQYKYNNLLEIIFAIGAYCLFKKKYSYIKDLWEYKQPSDSDSLWIGHDIIPNNLDRVIQFYLKRDLFDQKFYFWEGHHGNRLYFKQYFILLLLRILQNIPPNEEGHYPQIENINLPYLNVHKLYDLEYSVNDLLTMSSFLKENTSLLSELGFDLSKIDELFNVKLETYLKNLSNKANQQIKALHRSSIISKSKIEEFKEEVLKGFAVNATMRNIFNNYLRAYVDKSDVILSPDNKVSRFGLNIIDDKGAFLDEWYVHYANWGENYGSNLASGENEKLLKEFVDSCKDVSKRDFGSILSEFKNPKDLLIIATNYSLWKYFENDRSIKPNHIKKNEPLEIEGFAAWYEFNDSRIPIFEIFNQKFGNVILVVDKTTMGQLIQYSPLKNKQEKIMQKEIFYMNVQSFSEDQDLMKEFLSDPPEWLKKVGDDMQKEEHLQTRVLIQIFERFNVERTDKIRGYKIFVDEYGFEGE